LQEDDAMRALTSLLVALALAISTSSPIAAKAPEPEQFVVSLYNKFAFREPQPAEVTYWSERILTMTPEAAEKRLRHWFFVHCLYKTSLDKTVTIAEVSHLVDLLDSGKLTYEALQWSIFSSDEYKQAKAAGKAGKLMINFTALAKPL
jgi:hypothetical protein